MSNEFLSPSVQPSALNAVWNQLLFVVETDPEQGRHV